MDWDELDKEISPSKFTIKNMPARIEKRGDLFEPLLHAPIDMEKALEKLEALEP